MGYQRARDRASLRCFQEYAPIMGSLSVEEELRFSRRRSLGKSKSFNDWLVFSNKGGSELVLLISRDPICPQLLSTLLTTKALRTSPTRLPCILDRGRCPRDGCEMKSYSPSRSAPFSLRHVADFMKQLFLFVD